MKELTQDEIKYIIKRVLKKAADAQEDMGKHNDEDEKLFYEGLLTAYGQVIDVIRNQLLIYDMDLKNFGLEIDYNERFT